MDAFTKVITIQQTEFIIELRTGSSRRCNLIFGLRVILRNQAGDDVAKYVTIAVILAHLSKTRNRP